MLVSEINRLNFENMIRENLYYLIRIRNGNPASRFFKSARISSFVDAGILGFGDKMVQYQVLDEASAMMDVIRHEFIRGD